MAYKVELHKYKNELSFKNKLGRLIWNVFCLFFFRPFGSRFLNFWRKFVLKLFGAKIGENCTIASSVKIWAPWNLEMKDHSMLDKNVNCYNPGKVIIHSETVVSEGVFLCTASHNIFSSKHNLVVKPIVIYSQVWVAVDSFIMMGVTIGEGAVVGARAAVFKDVEAWTVVGGNPAKFIKKRVLDNE
jgi:putative colanic acid biosynthesis acetyltransferase WcaF